MGWASFSGGEQLYRASLTFPGLYSSLCLIIITSLCLIIIIIFCFVSIIVCISIHEFHFFSPDSTYHWVVGLVVELMSSCMWQLPAGVKPPHHQKTQLPKYLEKALPSGKPHTCPRRPENSWPDMHTRSLMGLRRATPFALPQIPIRFVCDRWSAPGRQDTCQWGKLPTEID